MDVEYEYIRSNAYNSLVIKTLSPWELELQTWLYKKQGDASGPFVRVEKHRSCWVSPSSTFSTGMRQCLLLLLLLYPLLRLYLRLYPNQPCPCPSPCRVGSNGYGTHLAEAEHHRCCDNWKPLAHIVKILYFPYFRKLIICKISGFIECQIISVIHGHG